MCRAAGKDILLGTWKRLEDRMRIVLLSVAREDPLPIMARDQHLPIVEAIERGDARDGVQLVFDHMNEAASFYRDALS